VARCQRHDVLMLGEIDRIGADQQGGRTHLGERRKGEFKRNYSNIKI
jgi:hypothetical protein